MDCVLRLESRSVCTLHALEIRICNGNIHELYCSCRSGEENRIKWVNISYVSLDCIDVYVEIALLWSLD